MEQTTDSNQNRVTTENGKTGIENETASSSNLTQPIELEIEDEENNPFKLDSRLVNFEKDDEKKCDDLRLHFFGENATRYCANNTSPKNQQVFINGDIQRILPIEAQNNIEATLNADCTWLATEDDVKEYVDWQMQEKNGKDWRPSWMPNLEIDDRSEGELKLKEVKLFLNGSKHRFSWLEDVESYFELNAELGVWICAKYEFDGKLNKKFELQSFPFDCQSLKIKLQCRNCERILPLPTQKDLLSLNKKTVCFDFQIQGLAADFGILSQDERKDNEMTVVVKVARYWKSCLKKLLVEGVLTFLSLLVFSLPAGSDLGNRLNYVMAVTLTDVVLQGKTHFGSNNFTVLDKFIGVSFLFKALVLIWVALPSFPLFSIDVFKNKQATNVSAAWIFTILYFVYVVWSVIYFGTIRHIEQRKLDKSVSEIGKECYDDRKERVYLQLNDDDIKRFMCADGVKNNSNQQGHPLLGRKEVILFLSIMGLSTWGLHEVLGRKFAIELAIIFGPCIIGNFLKCCCTCSTYYHNYWLNLSVIATSITSCVRHSTNTRAILMTVAISCWYGLVFLFDVWCDKSSGSQSEQFAAKYVRVNTKWPGKQPCSLQQSYEVLFLGLKYLVLGANQGIQALVVLLPVFVVELEYEAVNSENSKLFSWKADAVGIISFCVAAVLLFLSLFYVDSRSIWKEHRTFQTICYGNENQHARLLKQSKVDCDGQATSDRGKKVSNNDKKPHPDFLNPFRKIRYPAQMSEIGMCISMWLFSTVVCEHGFLICVSALAPAYMSLYHGLFMVPLLDNLADNEFAKHYAYQQYKNKTNWFLIEP